MKTQTVALMVSAILISVLASASHIRTVSATGTIYILADGSITPPTANITTTDNVTYTFTASNHASLSIQRNNIVVNGAGYTLQGDGVGYGVDLAARQNVTIRNTIITLFDIGVNMDQSDGNHVVNNTIANSMHDRFGGYAISMFLHCDDNTISDNTIVNNERGVELLEYCNRNTISGNFVNNTYDWYGITLFYSHANKILNNVVAYSRYSGIYLGGYPYNLGSQNNIVSGNTVTNTVLGGTGIQVNAREGGSSKNNTVVGNNVIDNTGNGISLRAGASENRIVANEIKDNDLYGIRVERSGNTIYHNNFTNNYHNAVVDSGYTASWDHGYPAGGNYWSNYFGLDIYSGPYQNESGSDGIGDSPFAIEVNNEDPYPLMTPYLRRHDVAVEQVEPEATSVPEGATLHFNVTVANQGDFFETLNVTAVLHGIEAAVDNKQVSLLNEDQATLACTWNTTGYSLGNYTLRVEVGPVPGEVDASDNELVDGWVVVTLALVHDVAVTHIEVAKNIVGSRALLDINVTLANQGNYSESLTVHVSANASAIAVINLSEIAPGMTSERVCTWNTSGWALGNYTIMAFVEPVADEVNTDDNTLVDGWVFLTLAGDIDGDRDVDIFDIVRMAAGYGTEVPDPSYDPYCDIDGDGDIDIFDLVAAAGNYGENW